MSDPRKQNDKPNKPDKPEDENPGRGIGPEGTPPGHGGTPPGQEKPRPDQGLPVDPEDENDGA